MEYADATERRSGAFRFAYRPTGMRRQIRRLRALRPKKAANYIAWGEASLAATPRCTSASIAYGPRRPVWHRRTRARGRPLVARRSSNSGAPVWNAAGDRPPCRRISRDGRASDPHAAGLAIREVGRSDRRLDLYRPSRRWIARRIQNFQLSAPTSSGPPVTRRHPPPRHGMAAAGAGF